MYADFASIQGIPGEEETAAILGSSSGGTSSGADCGTSSAGKSSKGKDCEPVNAKCNVNQIFTPGDAKQKSSNIAIKAAQDAKAANDAQQAAGQLAAQHIKQELAEKAFQSAKAAEAALTGKQMMVQQLEVETHEASAVVEEETSSLQNTEANMNAAVEAARAATQQFEIMDSLHKQMKDNCANIQAVALGAQQEVGAKVALLEAAKARLISLQNQMEAARCDYEKTKTAAYKAACAAIEAKRKAASNTRRKRESQDID